MNWLLPLLVVTLAPFTTSETTFMCDGGYSGLQNSEHCYRLVTSPTNLYENARIYCQKEGGDLASIHSAFEDNFINSLGSAGKLIGLRYSESVGDYEWSDSTPLEYKNYVDGFEDNMDFYGYCAQHRSGKWYNADCDADSLPFVCERPAVSYTPTPNNVCPNSSILYPDGGTLLSPGYPNTYASGLNCVYKLAARNGHIIRLFLDSLEIAYGVDWFNMRRQHGSAENYLDLYPTEAAGYELVLKTNRLQIEFYSRRAGGRWKISWAEYKEVMTKAEASELADNVTANANEYYLCPSGYTLYGDQCYRLEKNALLSYYDAVQFCRDEGGDLASIHSSFEETPLESLAAAVGEAYIGLLYVGNDDYQWSDGSYLDYTNYDEQFIGWREYLGYCAKLKTGKWRNAECSDRLHFVCERKAVNVTASANNVCPAADTVYKSSGVLVSPGYPQLYVSSLPACQYELLAKKGYFIKLDLEEMAFPSSDWFQTYYLLNTQWIYAATVTNYGQSNGTQMVIPHNHILLVFGNPTKQSGRWRINWTQMLP